MGLFRKKRETIKHDDQDHLTQDGTLPYGWFYRNKDFLDQIKTEYSHFLNSWLDSRKKSPIDQYGALKSFVTYMNEAKALCHSKGECFAYWFDTSVADSDYIQKRTVELMELEGNRLELQDKYEDHQIKAFNLDNKIMAALKDNEGILQSDFVKLFDATVQDDVKEKLYYMDKCGKVQRIKSGRSYSLYTIKEQG